MTVTAHRPGVAFMPPPAVRGAALSGAAVLLLAADQGGFFPSAWRAGTVALLAAGALLQLWFPSPRPTRTSFALLGVLTLLGLLSVASAAWSLAPSASLLDAQRTLLYLAAFAAFAVAGPGLTPGVLAGSSAVAVWALAGRLLHGAPFDAYEGRLLTAPIGYANGLGALLAIAVAVSVGLALRRRLFAVPLVVLLPALALTNSRASWLACGVGCAVALLVHGRRPRLAAATVAVAALALGVLLAAAPSFVGDRAAWWGVARSAGVDHPLAGSGAGTFHLLDAGLPAAQDAHSLYLQVFAELGLVGLLLVVALFALPVFCSLRRALAAPAAGLTVYVLHAGVDWDWQLPAVTVAALALAAAVTCDRRRLEVG